MAGPTAGKRSCSSELLSCAEFQRAAERQLQRIAFPSLSTGAYGYPVDKAAPVALSEVIRFLKEENHSLREVRFVLFNEETYQAYETASSRIEGIVKSVFGSFGGHIGGESALEGSIAF